MRSEIPRTRKKKSRISNQQCSWGSIPWSRVGSQKTDRMSTRQAWWTTPIPTGRHWKYTARTVPHGTVTGWHTPTHDASNSSITCSLSIFFQFNCLYPNRYQCLPTNLSEDTLNPIPVPILQVPVPLGIGGSKPGKSEWQEPDPHKIERQGPDPEWNIRSGSAEKWKAWSGSRSASKWCGSATLPTIQIFSG